MCDAALDGDMYDPNTPSGKWAGAEPEHVQGIGWQWPVQPMPMYRAAEPQSKASRNRFRRAWRILCGD